ncbi:uncharacterized protein C1orf131 homolog isoform X2 [Platichthys flesus]|uniref:uncharacterized protein C1orf131 homolog isoform X2 n=1 Tax=Platichthys flesus TaxID=8260 RepID=UPI002DB622BA|nr:uncharacterized protein C1orf131 homolog isoform X2 [Platichthys flesus]XP_062267260.1 uncharacterized protein C1orf131 homolog isoform X2 [Platichthys flesus]
MNSKSNGEKDEDQLFLEQLLDKFYEFDDGPASKKKLKKKKKRNRPEEEEEEEEDQLTAVKDVCVDTKDEQATNTVAEQQQQQQQPQTGAAVRQVSPVEVVTYQDYRKKLKTNQTPASNKTPAPQIPEKTQSDPMEEISLEKARLEVHRFGITGYKKEQQRVFEKDRAIMLGARPPKKDYVNYKLMQRQIQEKKQKAKEDVQPSDLKKKKKINNQRDRKKASSGSGAGPSGQVGRFKDGLLVLSSKEIQTIKGNKRSK